MNKDVYYDLPPHMKHILRIGMNPGVHRYTIRSQLLYVENLLSDESFQSKIPTLVVPFGQVWFWFW